MSEELQVGKSIPPFFLKDQEGYNVRDDDVVGTPLVLFFYHKDGIPICTEEVCGFRDQLEKFDILQTLIVGVSPDSVESHKKFITDNKLKFSLLSDEKKDMCRMYGVLNDKEQVIRTTFVINSRGVVKWMEKPVHIKGHIDRVLKAVEEFCKEEVINFDDFQKDYADFLQGSLKPSKNQKQIQEQIMKEFGIKKSDIEKKKK